MMHGLTNFKFIQTDRQTNRHEHPITHAFGALYAEDALRTHFTWSSWSCYFRHNNQTDINEEIH